MSTIFPVFSEKISNHASGLMQQMLRHLTQVCGKDEHRASEGSTPLQAGFLCQRPESGLSEG
jgi:hypothetical protein